VSARGSVTEQEGRRDILRNFVSNNFEITHAFYTHPKILITALNGPVVGLSAAVIAYSDFIYAAPHTYLLTPFSSLGLVAEGGASKAFVERLGISKANEALLMSKRITCEELVQTGFVNKVFDVSPGEDAKFLEMVLAEIDDRLGPHLVPSSLLKIKRLIRKPDMKEQSAQLVEELLGGLEVFEKGIPQQEFMKVATGQKRHKL
jgi:peroxisomal 3,2-trans-enoyl-CoA isomerase